jgi:hypothetical protein
MDVETDSESANMIRRDERETHKFVKPKETTIT